MLFIQVSNISKTVGQNVVVKRVSFTQEKLQHIAIVGETGSGKTTLLKLVGGFVKPDEGEVLFEEKKIINPEDELFPGHPGIAFLSQYFELRNNYWVRDYLEMANKLTEEKAIELYKICQVDHLLQRRTNQLSGGEKQRIALARLLTTSPRLLLLDEPYSNLDAMHKRTIKQVIDDISEQLGITCILVSHDAADVLSWADKILVMQNGELIQQGTAEEIYQQPVNEYAAGLVGDYNLIDVNKAPLFGSFTSNDTFIIRPENIHVTATGQSHIFGIAQRISFFGSYYLLEVLVEQQLIKVRTQSSSHRKGELVFLAVEEKQIIQLNN